MRRNGFWFAVLMALPTMGMADIVNPGFEDGWSGWTDGDTSGSGTALSGEAHSGQQSVKLTEKGAYVAQIVSVRPDTTYRLSALVRGPGNVGVKVGAEMFFEAGEERQEVARGISHFLVGTGRERHCLCELWRTRSTF